jgi:hypothetical protein
MMSQKWRYLPTGNLVILLAAFAATPAVAQQAGATVDSVTQVSPGRYRITGTALAADGNLACALALASGRCMFTCGPGSLRCEGGTDPTIPFGRFDLTDLPTETNGTIVLQVFVQGNISFTRTINPGGGGGGGSARWSALTNVCCDRGPLTYQVTIDGVTKSSTNNSCGSTPSFEGFASTTPGSKNWVATVVSSACSVNAQGSGTVTLATNACYQFVLNRQGQNLVNSFGTVTCPSSANANTLQEESQATPMAIFPMDSVDPSGTGQENWNLLRNIREF